MSAVVEGMTAPLCGQPLLFLLQTIPLAREAALLLLHLGGNAHHTKRLAIAADVAIQTLGHGQSVALVRLDLLAVFVPVPRTNDVISHPYPLQSAMQRVTEGAGLITGEDFLGRHQLLGAPQHEAP